MTLDQISSVPPPPLAPHSSTRTAFYSPTAHRGATAVVPYGHGELKSPSSAGDVWDADASILLLGIRGTGKTSLAVVAASHLGFRLVDADQHFYAATGLPRAAYASKYGLEQYRMCELAQMRAVLQENPSRCIIVCGPGSAEGTTGQELLEEFKKRHPVIYIMRDPEEVDQYLRTHDAAQIARLAQLVTPSYRGLSNFEFYNLSEPASALVDDGPTRNHLQHHPSLILKHVERDFLRLIRSIRSQDARPSLLQARHSLSFLAAERKPFTYALTIPLARVMDVAAQLRSQDLIVDALELVIDLEQLLPDGGSFDHNAATSITRQYYTLRRNVRLPVIFHVKMPGGASAGLSAPVADPTLWSTYFDVLAHGLRLAPEYLTLELTSSPEAARILIANKSATKIMGHFFDSAPPENAWDSPSRLQLVERADRWGCDLVRICQAATSFADNAAVQRFVFRAESVSRLPLIAYNTGRTGRNSCFMNQILTPVAHELVHAGIQSLGDEMLTVQAAQNALYSSFVLDPLVFGIFGNAVNAALSPMMHNAAFQFCRLPHHYRTFQSSSLRDLDPIVSDCHFGGASISAPFKKEIIPVLDYISPEAQAIGAVNTVIPLRSRSLESLVDRNRAGPVVALFGDNTDWIGIHTCIRRNLSPINAVKPRTTALILGAGGMAQAAVYAAIRLGVRTIFVFNRTLAHAERVVDQFNGKSFSIHNIDLARRSPPLRSGTSTPIDQRTEPAAVHVIPSMDETWPAGFDPPTIIVACISRVGRDDQPPPDIVLPDAWLRSPSGGVAIELAYNPIDTPFYRQVRSLSSKGWIAVHGLHVLPEQGIAQFELFTGRKAPQHLMRSKVAQQVET
ncbi:hypothetical protein VTK73DRAFT_5063 [Phialemonium thermophilum]|uniref:Quinate repressor protein n=1 Tax=Phialemonium thermophilum TaxID=223376 RepID=A0ABR3WQN8_9PEZI